MAFKIQRLQPRVEVGLIHEPRCTNDPCTCLDDNVRSIVMTAFVSITKMLNDHELLARVDKMYYDGVTKWADEPGFEWYYDPSPFALYDYVGFLFI